MMIRPAKTLRGVLSMRQTWPLPLRLSGNGLPAVGLLRNKHHPFTLPLYQRPCGVPQLPSVETTQPDPKADNSDDLVPEDRNKLFTIAFERSVTPMVIAAVGVGENPILLANQAFLDLTGYSLPEVLGKDCRFLQGSRTSKATIAAIEAAIKAELNVDVVLVNYRKDGSEFWNELHISPIRDDEGKVVNYFASQIDVTQSRRVPGLEASEKRLLREVDHRAKNVMAVVNSIVRLSKSDDPDRYAASVRERVQTLADVHIMLAEQGWHSVMLAELLRQQFKTLGLSAVRLEGLGIAIDATDAQPIALIIHELAVNAMRHGALAHQSGTLNVKWRQPVSGGIEVEWKEAGGTPPAAIRKSGFGTIMVDALVERQLRGSIQRDWLNDGLLLMIRLPGKKPG